jgi:hypothetical protein
MEKGIIIRDASERVGTTVAWHRCVRTVAMRWYLFWVAVVFGGPIAGQEILSAPEGGTGPILFPADVMMLEAAEQREDLGCKVDPDKVFLGMDLKFHGGYEVSVPVREVRATKLTILFRLIPRGREPIHFIQKVPIPEIPAGTTGALNLHGEFELGQGSYHVDWLIRDALGRYCSAHWDLRAQLGPKDREVTVALPPESVRPLDREQFVPEPSVQRAQGGPPTTVKLLVNFAPQNPGAAALDPLDTAGLVSILRTIARNPEIQHFSVTAFNLEGRQMLYHQSYIDRIDFPSLGDAIQKLGLGTVNVTQLVSKNGDVTFLTKLLENEAGAEPRPDAFIFVGLKVQLDSGVREEEIKKVRELGSPVFYLNYAPDRQAFPWRDTVGRVVKFFKGREYTISGPLDLCNAVSDMMSRIFRFKQTRRPGGRFEGSQFPGESQILEAGKGMGDRRAKPAQRQRQPEQTTAEPDASPSHGGGWREAIGAAMQGMASNRSPTAFTATAEDEPSFSDVSIANVKLHDLNGLDDDACSVSYTLSNRFHRPVTVTVDVSVNAGGSESHARYVDRIGPNTGSDVKHDEHLRCPPADADRGRAAATVSSVQVR